MATPIPLIKKKIIWSWQSNPYQCDDKEKEGWNRYSDFEIEAIEKGYKQKMITVELGDRVINLNHMVQINKVDEQKSPVKREEVDARKYLREQRFCYTEKPVKSLAMVDRWIPQFLKKWETRFEASMGCRFSYLKMLPQIVEQAAKGILTEGKLQGKEFDGQAIHDELMKVKDKELQEIERCCVFLYTAESFLYQLANSTLRATDCDKIDTLGAYCYLLWYYLYKGNEKTRTLYRGSTLTDEMINEYKKAKGTSVSWLAFTSASKSREVAEIYNGNTLFIITTKSQKDSDNWSKDISSISNYTEEEEILITAGHPFKVNRVDSENGKHVIYLTLSS